LEDALRLRPEKKRLAEIYIKMIAIAKRTVKRARPSDLLRIFKGAIPTLKAII